MRPSHSMHAIWASNCDMDTMTAPIAFDFNHGLFDQGLSGHASDNNFRRIALESRRAQADHSLANASHCLLIFAASGLPSLTTMRYRMVAGLFGSNFQACSWIGT